MDLLFNHSEIEYIMKQKTLRNTVIVAISH